MVFPKQIHLISLCLAILLAGCKKPAAPTGEQKEFTSLSELAALSSSSSSEFDIVVKDVVVTAVYGNYAQIEDESSGAQVNKSAHGLTAGQKISGKVTGKARVTSGGLVLSLLDVSAADISSVSELPLTDVSLQEIQKDMSTWLNRRVRLKGVTFVNGFNGEANGAGQISQRGKQITATCRPAGVVIPDGAQGDLVCYLSSAGCYVFSGEDFDEHELDSPLTELSVFGVYDMSGDAPTPTFVYAPKGYQYSFSNIKDTRGFRIQNYADRQIVSFSYPAVLKSGMEITLHSSMLGVEQLSSGDRQVVVEKLSGDRLWLMDYASNTGYVFMIVE